jgi:hypothetical protein
MILLQTIAALKELPRDSFRIFVLCITASSKANTNSRSLHAQFGSATPIRSLGRDDNL